LKKARVALFDGVYAKPRAHALLCHTLLSSFAGDSAAAPIMLALRAGFLHSSLSRLLPLMPLPAAGKAPGGRSKKQTQQPAVGPTFAVAGCSSVALAALSWTAATFVVSPPAPGEQGNASVQLTVQWAVDGGASSSSTGARSTGAEAPGLLDLGQSLSCAVAAEPALPAWVATALAAFLDAGQEQAFLDAASIVAVPAAALQRCALEEEAQRAAGLPPGAVVLGHSGVGGEKEGAREKDYSCTLLLSRGDRSARLGIEFTRSGGGVLLRLQPPRASGVDAEGWAPRAWERVRALPGFCKCGAEPGQEHWLSGFVPLAGLGDAVRAVLEGLAGEGVP